MVTIDLSLNNEKLYKGCQIEEVAGRKNLTTPLDVALGVVGKNAADIVAEIQPSQRDEVTLTGPMAVWSYLVVFHQVVHSFRRVSYNDGKGPSVLIAAHG